MILPKLGHGLHQGVDHTNPFSNENGAVLLLIQLLSTLQCRKQSPKMEQFENALQSGAIWKRCFLKTLFSSVDRENDVIWKRWRNQNRHNHVPDHLTVSIQNGGRMLPCGFNFRANFTSWYIEMCMHWVHLSMRTEGIKAFSKRIWRCGVDGQNTTKTISVDANLFENGAKQPLFLLKTD